MTLRIGASFLLLAACITSPLAARANLLTNGGFQLTNNGYSETMTPEGWTNIGHIDGVIADSVFGTPSYNGFTYYYDTGGYGQPLPNAGDGIEQTVGTTPGAMYNLSFGYSDENAVNAGESLEVLLDGSVLATY